MLTTTRAKQLLYSIINSELRHTRACTLSRAQKSSSSSPCTLLILSDRSCGAALSIRTPSPLPRAELPLAIDCADLLQGQPSGSRLHSAPGKRPHLHPIEPVQQHTQWLLLRRAQTVPLLLRARRSGMRVPPDLSSNSRYDAIAYPMAEEKPPSLPPCHAPATATKIRPTDSDQFVQSLSNPTTCTTYACKSTSKTTPSSNGAST